MKHVGSEKKKTLQKQTAAPVNDNLTNALTLTNKLNEFQGL